MQNFNRFCQNKKIKITPQRTAIYQAIYQEKSHPSTKYIYEKVKNKFPNISFDTIYRTLKFFNQIGLVQIIEQNTNIKRFDPIVISHPHFHCIKCEAIYDIDIKIKQNYLNKIKDKNIYKITDEKLLLKGICQACKNNN